MLAGDVGAATRPRTRRRTLIALAATAVAVGSVAAIAPAREAVLRFFDIGGVRVVTTTSPTAVPASTDASGSANPLGAPISLADARARAPFPLRLPTIPGTAPDRVLVQTPPRGGAYALIWHDAAGVAGGELIVTQFPGRLVAEKTLDPGLTTVQPVDVDGTRGYWLTGGPHTIGYLDNAGAFRTETTRSVGDVLIWERSGVTYRVEGAAGLAQGLRVAASLR